MGHQQNRQSFETGLAASFASFDIPFEGICVKDIKGPKDPKDPKDPKSPLKIYIFVMMPLSVPLMNSMMCLISGLSGTCSFTWRMASSTLFCPWKTRR